MFTEVLLLFNQLCFPKSICVFLSTFSWSDYLDTSSLFSKVNFNCVKSLLYYQWKTKEYIPNSSFYFWLFAINSEAALWDSMKTKGAKRLHCRKKKIQKLSTCWQIQKLLPTDVNYYSYSCNFIWSRSQLWEWNFLY